MTETSAQILKDEHNNAVAQLVVAAGAVNGGLSDVLPPRTRHELVGAIASGEFVERTSLGRTASQRQRWKALVQESVKRPKSLGFVEFKDGTDGLALKLGVGDQSTWSRTLKKWSTVEPPLVECGSAPKGRGRPQLKIVQIPLLTEWLLWVVQTTSIRLNPRGRDYLWESHIRDLPALAIRQLWPPGSPDLSRDQADRIIDGLKHGRSIVRRLLR